MDIRDGRYERLRYLVAGALLRAEQDYAKAVTQASPDSIALSALEDGMEEWALLLAELDAAAPSDLKAEILPWPCSLPSPTT